MFMFEDFKKEVKSNLVFQFMKNAIKPQYIEILNLKKDIPKNKDEIEITKV